MSTLGPLGRVLTACTLIAATTLPVRADVIHYLDAVQDDLHGVDGLAFVLQEAISPDGRHLYAPGASDNGVAVFARDGATGALTFVEVQRDGEGGVDGLAFASSAAVSPDGQNVYVTGSSDDAVAVFARSAVTGALTFVEAQRNEVGGVQGLAGARGVTVSPDGRHVYVVGQSSNALAVFTRDATSGALNFVTAYFDGVADVDGLGGVLYVTTSADGANVYTASWGASAVAVFARDADTGLLTFVQVLRNGVDGVDGLGGVHSVAVSADGRSAYAAGQADGALVVFDRGPDGALSPAAVWRNGAGGATGLGGALWVTLSADDRDVFVASTFDSAVAAFDRDPTSGALTFDDAEFDQEYGVRGLLFARSATTSPDGRFLYVGGASSNAIAIFGIVHPCEICAPSGGCHIGPQPTCRTTAAPASAILKLKKGSGPAGDALLWEWRKGGATTEAEFGDPRGQNGYALCVFDESQADVRLLLRSLVEGGDRCGQPFCWRTTPHGSKYRDPRSTAGGITVIDLRAGADRKAKIVVAGRGPELALATLPVAGPVRVQLQSQDGACWEAHYPTSRVSRNNAQGFAARAE